MTDQFSLNLEAATKESPKYFSVTELTAKIKNLLEGTVGEAWLKAEVSNLRPSAAGHYYFNLKDSNAVLSCAMFRGAASKYKQFLKDGLEVIVHGKISVYPPRGSYQLIVDLIEPVGHGALQLAFEELKKKLVAEGLFEASRKKMLPEFPTRVAIVTSPTGAALQDMLNVLGRRNIGISVMVVPTLVQGTDAAPKIVKAIEIANEHQLGDVIIVARGGGSLEDLWCFNEEAVVRAIAASELPVISAVGHEVDFTLSDFAADLRAPTPSAAAELVSKNRVEVVEQINSQEKRLVMAFRTRLSTTRSTLLALEKGLISPAERLMRLRKQVEEMDTRMKHSLEMQIPFNRQRLDDLQSKIFHAVDKKWMNKKREFESLTSKLDALSPLNVLGRGYTLIKESSSDVPGKIIKSAKQAKSMNGQNIQIVFHDGNANAKLL